MKLKQQKINKEGFILQMEQTKNTILKKEKNEEILKSQRSETDSRNLSYNDSISIQRNPVLNTNGLTQSRIGSYF